MKVLNEVERILWKNALASDITLW